MKRLSGAQWTGAILTVLLAILSIVLLILGVVDGIFDAMQYLPDFRPALIVNLVSQGVLTLTGVLGVITMATRSRVLSTISAITAFIGAALLALFEVTLGIVVADYGYGLSWPSVRFGELSDIFAAGYIPGVAFTLTSAVLSLVAGVLLLISQREPAPQAARIATNQQYSPTTDVQAQIADGAPSHAAAPPTPSPPPMPTPPPPVSEYFIQADGIEYGPFDAATILGFVSEGRVIETSLIRPAGGRYEPAASVPGLFPRRDGQ